MKRVRLAAFASVLALAGCSTTEIACTEIGVSEGASIEVLAPLAANAVTAMVQVCWDGTCSEQTVELMESYGTAAQDCEGTNLDDSCSAQATPTGDKNGFVNVPDLPESEVEITVKVHDLSGTEIATDTVAVTPVRIFPNGPQCDNGGVQTRVIMSASGDLS